MKREVIINQYPDESFLFTDGFDEAIIGVDESSMRVIYSVSACMQILRRTMTEEEAIDHFEYNVGGSHMGDRRRSGAMTT